ncbi:MAG: M1 family aminopeptidase [Nitrospirota bacterium]|nr:M1 family aminopeptidase [Nitrospirota bacterium]
MFRVTRVFLPILAAIAVYVLSAAPGEAIPRKVPPATIVSHTLDIDFNLSEHLMKVKNVALFRPEGRKEITFSLNSRAVVEKITVGGKEAFWDYEKDKGESVEGSGKETSRTLRVWLPDKWPSDIVQVEMVYSLTLYDVPKVPAFSREFIADESAGIIGEEGIFLSAEGRWYPDTPGSMPTWRITANTPAGYEVMAAGERIQREVQGNRLVTTWDFPYPSPDFHLVAGKYEITEDRLGPIKIYTYFYPEERGLAADYIKAVKEYLELYQNLLGRYPFTKFAVVENFYPTGYGMPSYTLLGRDVIKLPFIISTSLGHEIAHNWWGNSVYVDYDRGNWSEGLTTYTADYLYKERKSAADALDYRRQICVDYSNYVTGGQDFPLTEFRGRTTPATRAVGYGKTAMTFHMLRKLMGDVKFYETLRHVVVEYAFKPVDWRQLMQVFERTSGYRLAWFYRQWIERAGAPMLTMAPMKVERKNGQYEIEVEVTQSGPGITPDEGAYLLDLPVKIVYEGGEIIETRRIHETVTPLRFKVPGNPVKVVLDPSYDIFRKLGREEIPPVIGQVLGDSKQLFILPSGGSNESRAAYGEIARQLARAGGVVIKTDTEVVEGEWKEYSIIVFGGPEENRVFAKLARELPKGVSVGQANFTLNGTSYDQPGDFLLLTLRNPDNQDKGAMFMVGLGPGATTSAGRKITHYGKYSYLVFSDGVNKGKGVWEGR